MPCRLTGLRSRRRQTQLKVKEISSASDEQNTGTDQINQSIQQLDQVIRQNAAAAEHVSAASEELSGQSVQLLEAIRFFKSDASKGRERTLPALSREQQALPEIKQIARIKSQAVQKKSGPRLHLVNSVALQSKG